MNDYEELKRSHAALVARVRALEDAAQPIANYIPPYSPFPPDDFILTKGSPRARDQITAGMVRRLAQALKGLTDV